MTTLKFHWQLRHRRCQSLRAVLQGKSAFTACQLDYFPVVHIPGSFTGSFPNHPWLVTGSVALKVQYVLHDSSRQCWSIKLKCPVTLLHCLESKRVSLILTSVGCSLSSNCHKLVICSVGAHTVKLHQTPNQLTG